MNGEENAIEQNESVEKLIYRAIEEKGVADGLILEHGPARPYCQQRVGQMLYSCVKSVSTGRAEGWRWLTECLDFEGSVMLNMLNFSTPAIMASMGRSGSYSAPLRLASVPLLLRVTARPALNVTPLA